MAGIERIAAHIYHERQESGSALCAQHALNSLLQGSYFNPSDLATIAQSLDALERHVDEGRLGRPSANMDDTGFFSIQVLENALNVWGQSLIRWRSESMQPYHDSPQNQRAFILNCDQHWFTLRKFGDSEGVGPWFNLNSSLERPEWVSETYLGVLLQQSEADGYSTFAVVPIDPDHPLPRSDADDVASSPLPSSFGAQRSYPARSPRSPGLFEDEDFQLQAALHASLDGPSVSFPMPPPHVGPVASSSRVGSPGAVTGFPNPSLRSPPSPVPPPIPPPSTRPTDRPMENPVAASMARNQAMLERMRQEQEVALREHYPRPGSHVVDDEEQLRIALAVSEAMAREQGEDRTGGGDAAGTRERSENIQEREGRAHGGRVYDDEDADFQAALQASLETAPSAHTPNTTAPPLPTSTRPPPPASRSIAGPHTEPLAGADDGEDDDYYEPYSDDDQEDTATEVTSSDAGPPPTAQDVSVEEMRRRRLERFGENDRR